MRTVSRCTELGNVLVNLSKKRIQVGRAKVQSAKDPAEQWLGRARANMAGSPLNVRSSVLPPTSPRMPSTQLSTGQRAVSSLPGRKEGRRTETQAVPNDEGGYHPHLTAPHTRPTLRETCNHLIERGHLSSFMWEKNTIPYRNCCPL